MKEEKRNKTAQGWKREETFLRDISTVSANKVFQKLGYATHTQLRALTQIICFTVAGDIPISQTFLDSIIRSKKLKQLKTNFPLKIVNKRLSRADLLQKLKPIGKFLPLFVRPVVTDGTEGRS